MTAPRGPSRVADAAAAVAGRVLLAVGLLLSLPAVGCDPIDPSEAVQIHGARLTVQNRTDRTWAAVEIWVNDHYRVEVPSLAPGQVAQVDLRTLVAGFGQRFDPTRQPVRGVEVSAREGARREVKLTWGTVRRR